MPVSNRAFWEEIISHVQPKPSLAHLEANFSCPVTCCLREEADRTFQRLLSVTSLRELSDVSKKPRSSVFRARKGCNFVFIILMV